jgi:hypothetical protein
MFLLHKRKMTEDIKIVGEKGNFDIESEFSGSSNHYTNKDLDPIK